LRPKTSTDPYMTSTPVQCDLTFNLTSQFRLSKTIEPTFVYYSPTTFSSIANPHDKSLDHFTMCYISSHFKCKLIYVFFLFPLNFPFSIFSSFGITPSISDTHTHTHTHIHTHDLPQTTTLPLVNRPPIVSFKLTYIPFSL
jgi:hypothetical protein